MRIVEIREAAVRLEGNVAFGLPRRLPRAERARLAREALERVHLGGSADALPKASMDYYGGPVAVRAAPSPPRLA